MANPAPYRSRGEFVTRPEAARLLRCRWRLSVLGFLRGLPTSTRNIVSARQVETDRALNNAEAYSVFMRHGRPTSLHAPFRVSTFKRGGGSI